jgi:hypothetical protein
MRTFRPDFESKIEIPRLSRLRDAVVNWCFWGNCFRRAREG